MLLLTINNDSKGLCSCLDAGLFQIVGPEAMPSSSDLTSVDEDTRAAIESLPSRRLTSGASRNSLTATSFADRRPSLEAQLRVVDSETATSWLPSKHRHGQAP